MYKVYVLSMQQRYFVEIMIFMLFSIVFQFYIDKYNIIKQSLSHQITAYLEDGATLGMTDIEISEQIESLNAQLHLMEIDDEIALILACISFAYPIRIITRIIFSRLTERRITIKFDDYIDMAFFSASFTWAGDFVGYLFV